MFSLCVYCPQPSSPSSKQGGGGSLVLPTTRRKGSVPSCSTGLVNRGAEEGSPTLPRSRLLLAEWLNGWLNGWLAVQICGKALALPNQPQQAKLKLQPALTCCLAGLACFLMGVTTTTTTAGYYCYDCSSSSCGRCCFCRWDGVDNPERCSVHHHPHQNENITIPGNGIIISSVLVGQSVGLHVVYARTVHYISLVG